MGGERRPATALLSMMYSSMNGFPHAAALVGSAGVPVAEFTKPAVDWFLPSVIGEILKAEAPTIDNGEYPGREPCACWSRPSRRGSARAATWR
ncbi:hypothetical protein [Amycolatopsis sp. cmx-4-54]|uniref:imine reductase family protein n=1 Tax=Amycolatopsis sp. cmx-4-54 TaxID=2790936 RepID=UPI00397B1484